MLDKKALNKAKILLKYNFSMRFFAVLIPYFIVMPICIFAFKKYGIQPQTEEIVVRYTQFFIPINIILLLLPLLNNYVGSNKNEVLYLHHRIIIMDIILSVVIYLIILIPEYLLFLFLMDISFVEYFRIFIEIIFFSSLAYFLCFILNSITVGYLIIFIYYFLSITVMPQKWFVFFNVLSFGKELFFEIYLYLLILSLVLFANAFVKNKYINIT